MGLYEELVGLEDERYNHRIIVHGIHGERKVIHLPLATFVLRVCALGERDTIVRENCNFPIKEVIVNQYTKRLTDAQYSALLTLLAYCKEYRVPLPHDCVYIKYTSDRELKYDDAFKLFLTSNIDFEENAWLIGYNTGDIKCVVDDYSYAGDVLHYLAYVAVHRLPDCVLNEENYDDGSEPVISGGYKSVGPFPETAFKN